MKKGLITILFIYMFIRIGGYNYNFKDAVDFQFKENYLVIICEDGDKFWARTDLIQKLVIKRR